MVPQTNSFLITTTFLFTLLRIHLQPISALDFIFNTFNSSSLLLYGNSTIQSSTLTLTSATTFSIGRALYPHSVPTKPHDSIHPLPFSTSFIFSVSPSPHFLPGHGFAFVFAPSSGINGTSSSQHLGLLNFTNDGNSSNHMFAVKFDVFKNQEFNDVSDNHVGLNVNSLTSFAAHDAGYWAVGEQGALKFRELKLNDGENYQVWIDYFDSKVNVTMARAGKARPAMPLINASVDLSAVFLDQMFVGFCAATGQLAESHRILSWSFSNSNSSIGDALVTSNLPSFVPPKDSVLRSKGFIVGVSIGGVCVAGCGVAIYVVLIQRKRGKKEVGEDIENWELEYWPHRIGYEEIYTATNGFSEENVMGYGGNGKVYKGMLVGGTKIAVKRISHETGHGVREFLAEVSSLGRSGSNGRASAQTDVFGFGVLVLEVVCGQKPVEERKPGLIDWVWGLKERGNLSSALDERLKGKGGYSEEEVVRVLHLGLLCAYPDPNNRPMMRQILKVLEGSSEGNQSAGEGVEMNLLDITRSPTRSHYRQNIAGVGHPSYADIRESFSSFYVAERVRRYC
ncbi:hypothetical protein RJ639_016331 [Escallonia herrerae]|uniref:Legume lectin domain-containing protein n=1 Tax=Escallonia herrerae TaxID=1293975 RepID=A0AA89AKB6_9ASTE|nr:hypothetical protein RJ639_016331 [Escallonia herrerae]